MEILQDNKTDLLIPLQKENTDKIFRRIPVPKMMNEDKNFVPYAVCNTFSTFSPASPFPYKRFSKQA